MVKRIREPSFRVFNGSATMYIGKSRKHCVTYKVFSIGLRVAF